MIKTIEIIIQNNISKKMHALILYPLNICYKNNKEYKVTNEFLENIIRTIRTWKNEYGNHSNLIDSEEFNIIIETKDTKETYHGKGLYPENYDYLKNLLGELHD